MRKIILLFIIFACAITWAEDDVVLAPNIVPPAMAAKQIAPGVKYLFTIGNSIGACEPSSPRSMHSDFCRSEREYGEDKISGFNARLDINLYNITWPKTENTEGAENWYGHTFGGGMFLTTHYSIPLEIGISPIIVQWLGPIYVGAAYDLSFGHYFGYNRERKGYNVNYTYHFDAGASTNNFSGSLNLGGGTMFFMNNHGLAFGAHAGLRQLHIINAGENQNGNPATRFSYGYKLHKWIFYYGLEFANYSNLPLLKEANQKQHFFSIMSYEMGLHTETNPVIYWSFSFSLLL